jgi:hypothetical protein
MQSEGGRACLQLISIVEKYAVDIYSSFVGLEAAVTWNRARPIANGLRTDHPIPDLPFVNESHIPVDDPTAVEAVGRYKGEGMWGREDSASIYGGEGWAAFTTDPVRRDLAWCVRWHPAHGRSVVLYRDDDAAGVHQAWEGQALLFRAGSYWWDGATWYRPSQVWDTAGEDYYRRPVPAATTITAADLLDGRGDPERGRVLEVIDVDTDAPYTGRWSDDLALWASRRKDQASLPQCVVKISAPELTGDQLVGVAELAKIGGIAASTLRAYISRNEGDVPLPQANVSGHNVWARPVAEEWAEHRRRSPDGVTEVMSTDRAGAPVPVGIADVWSRFTRMFFSALWDNPGRRKRWALRWRNQADVRELAEGLGWYVAASVEEGKVIPIGDLAPTIHHAVLDEFIIGQELDSNSDPVYYGIARPVARMLGWLIRHHPSAAAQTLGEIVGDAERRLQIPRKVSERSLRTAMALDGNLDTETRNNFLDRVLSPNDSSRAD